MKELGEYFRTTRTNNGVSLEEASEDLNLSISQLENIEEGNIRAFQDVYKLKNYINSYAKYLGINPSEVVDSFDDFLFEHTSKISLDDIRKAQEEANQKEDSKIKSPYTKEYKEKINYWPFIICTIVVLVVIAIVILIVIKKVNEEPVRNTELSSVGKKEDLYELTY